MPPLSELEISPPGKSPVWPPVNSARNVSVEQRESAFDCRSLTGRTVSGVDRSK